LLILLLARLWLLILLLLLLLILVLLLLIGRRQSVLGLLPLTVLLVAPLRAHAWHLPHEHAIGHHTASRAAAHCPLSTSCCCTNIARRLGSTEGAGVVLCSCRNQHSGRRRFHPSKSVEMDFQGPAIVVVAVEDLHRPCGLILRAE
jgi:hypothetical protein